MSTIITDRIGQNKSSYQTVTKFEKEIRHLLYIFIRKKKQLTQQNVQQQHAHVANTVHIHRYDMSTVLLHCLITSMMHALSYSCSNHALDNQSPLRILLQL